MTSIQSESTQNLEAEMIELGQLYLERASEGDFKQPELLEKAASCFMTVLEQDPNQLEALMGLAYIAALSGLFKWSQDLIMQACLLYPKDLRVIQLEKEIIKLSQQVPSTEQPEDGLLGSLIEDINFSTIPSEFLIHQGNQLPELGGQA